MTYVDIINAFELVWWPVCGVAVAVRSRQSSPRWHRLGMTTAAILMLFGLSDGVELITKAWWNPWWLAVWKGACIFGLVVCAALRGAWLRHSSVTL